MFDFVALAGITAGVAATGCVWRAASSAAAGVWIGAARVVAALATVLTRFAIEDESAGEI